MKPIPPLQLEASFFTRSTINANWGFFKEKKRAREAKANVETRFRILEDGDTPGEFQIQLNVWTDPEADTLLPYDLDVEMVAIVHVLKDAEDTDRASRLAASGASILYSSIREHILSITSRGPWGGWTLPTISPATLVEEVEVFSAEQDEDTDHDKPEPKGRKQRRKA